MALDVRDDEERAHIINTTKNNDDEDDDATALTVAPSVGSAHSRPYNIVTGLTVVLAWIFWSIFVWTIASSRRQEVTTTPFAGGFTESWFTPQQQKQQQTATVHADEQKGSLIEGTLDRSKERDANGDFKQVNPSPMCKPFMQSPTTIWAEHVDRIHAASRLPGDSDFFNHDLHAVLLQLISPRLPSSVQMVEKDTAKIEVVLTKAYKRYQYLTQQLEMDDGNGREVSAPPPVVVLVMGGSVTRGKYCSVEGHESEISLESCSWAGRLEKLINALAGGELVVVHNMARGATDTRIGVVMLENKLLPSSAEQPDIVISAYSTNDQTKFPYGFYFSEEKFIRTVLQWRPCRESKYQPIMMHFDEYLGGKEDQSIVNILSATATRNFNTLVSYYGTSYASYAHAVRDIVFGDAKEYLLSPKEWFETDGEFHNQLHPGQGMHLSSSWVVAYNLLNMVTTYCSFESWKVAEGEKTMLYNHTKVPGLPTLRSSHGEPKGKARPSPGTIPPSLSSDLLLSTITDKWRSSQEYGDETQEKCHSDSQSSAPSQSSATTFDGTTASCPFKWWWGDYLGARPAKGKQIIDTTNVFAPVVEEYGGWSVSYGHNKMGWVPPSDDPVGSEFIFAFPRYNQTVRTITLLYMKSYGSGWDGSTADIQLSTKIDGAGAEAGTSWEQQQQPDSSSSNSTWRELTSTQLYGSHDSTTSEVYAERIKLPFEIQPGTQLRTSIKLVAGEKFKLMGLLVCS